MSLIIATQNPDKEAEIRLILGEIGMRIHSYRTLGIVGGAKEVGVSYEEIARRKVEYAKRPGFYIVSDDSGISLKHLGWKPNILSKRWAGPDATTEEITTHTLLQMIDAQDRSAIFDCVAALITPHGRLMFFRGSVKGTLLTRPRCEARPNMPYDPIFLPKGTDRTFAEMNDDELKIMNHRGIAFRQVRDYILQDT